MSCETQLARRNQQPATNQPTGHQMSRLRLYVTKKANFGAKMAIFGPKILIILEGSKSSGTHISENNLATSFCCCFVHICFLVGHSTKWISKANIWPKMTKNAYFGPNVAVLGQNPNYFERQQKFWYSHIRKPTRHLIPIFLCGHSNKMDQKGKYLAQNDEKCIFFGQKS